MRITGRGVNLEKESCAGLNHLYVFLHVLQPSTIQRDDTKYKYQLLPSPHFTSQVPVFVYRRQTPQVFDYPYENFPEIEHYSLFV